MGCCCDSNKRIIIVKNNDTDFNDGNLLELHLTTSILDLSTFKATLTLGDVEKKYNNISSGVIDFNLSAQETKSLPYGQIDGVLNLIDSSNRVATLTSVIPFRVISTVENNAIATSEVDYTINVQQGGETILNIAVESAVSVSVGTVETLPAGSEAYVNNVGTDNHLVLDFGIPQGIQGEQGEPGQDGFSPIAYVSKVGNDATITITDEQGTTTATISDGKDATINGYNAVTIVSGTGISVTTEGSEVVISNTQTSAEWGNITGTLANQTDLNNALNSKQDVISDLNTIRSGAEAGATALQPSDILDSVESTATDKALSANMGKSLQDEIDNLKARGRFLALWNCSTGLAETNPPESPYVYKAGDYFIVGVVGSTNYKPNGSSYTTGVASTTVETAEVAVDDVYYYDGTNWRLQQNTQKTVNFSNIAGDPYDNTNLANALNSKQDTISDLNTIRSGASAGATAVQPADLADYAKKNVAQTFTAVQTFNANVDIKDGSALKSESSDMIKRDNANSKINVGNGSDALSLNGSATRPTYNNNDLALKSDVTVSDVQINSTSVVTSGVANIPSATNSVQGVIITTPGYGLTINNSYPGTIMVNAATTSDITSKTNAYKPIVPSNLEAAIKTGITTNTYTLDSSEKAAATNWILPTQSANTVFMSDGTNATWDSPIVFCDWED